MSPTIRLTQPSTQTDFFDPDSLDAGDSADDFYLSFATDGISEKRTQMAYRRNTSRFLTWAHAQNLSLAALQTDHAIRYRQDLGDNFAAPSANQHLSALRGFFDRLTLEGVLQTNPFQAVHGFATGRSRSRHPRPSADDARRLLMSIEASTIAGLRDRALIASIVFSPARLCELIALNVADCHTSRHLGSIVGSVGDCYRFFGDFLDAYITTAGIIEDSEGPLFRTIGRYRTITDMRITRNDTFRMVRRRGRVAGLPPSGCCCRTLRAAALN